MKRPRGRTRRDQIDQGVVLVASDAKRPLGHNPPDSRDIPSDRFSYSSILRVVSPYAFLVAFVLVLLLQRLVDLRRLLFATAAYRPEGDW